MNTMAEVDTPDDWDELSHETKTMVLQQQNTKKEIRKEIDACLGEPTPAYPHPDKEWLAKVLLALGGPRQ